MKIGVCVGVLMGVCGLAMGQGPVDSCGSAQPTPDGSYAPMPIDMLQHLFGLFAVGYRRCSKSYRFWRGKVECCLNE